MDIVELELREQEAFERMEDSAGRVRGIKKCRRCHEKKSSSEFDTYIDKEYQERRRDYCRDCSDISGYDDRKTRGAGKRKNTNWRLEYMKSVDDFQKLSTLFSRVYRLLEEMRPHMNGDGYKVDAIEQEYHKLMGE